MKKLLLTLSLCAASFAYAGSGYYLTIYNNSSSDILVTGRDGGGNSCWNSVDFNTDSKGYVPARSNITMYSQIDTEGGCGDFVVSSHPFYQRFQVKRVGGNWTQFSLGYTADFSGDRGYIKNEATSETANSRGGKYTNSTYRAKIVINTDGSVGDNYMDITN